MKSVELPEGALSGDQIEKLRHTNKTVFMVTFAGVILIHEASWYRFNMHPTSYYFTNYLLAYGYMLRLMDDEKHQSK